jgi:hypothetical protein
VQKSDKIKKIYIMTQNYFEKKFVDLNPPSKQPRQLADVYDKALLATSSLFQQPLNWLPQASTI